MAIQLSYIIISFVIDRFILFDLVCRSVLVCGLRGRSLGYVNERGGED